MLGPDVALSQLSMNASPSGIILNNGSGAAIAVRITFHIINWILWVAKTYFYLPCSYNSVHAGYSNQSHVSFINIGYFDEEDLIKRRRNSRER